MNNIFKRPILVYSNYCKYSQEFLSILSQLPISQDFVLVSVDISKETRQRSTDYINLKTILQQQYNYNLKSVPTIIIENGDLILSDKDAFMWLQYMINTIKNSQQEPLSQEPTQKPTPKPIQKTQEELVTGFNHNEMFSFSDSYSTYGDTNDTPKQQSFQFINDIPNVATSTDMNVSKKQVKFQNDSFEPNKFAKGGTEKEKQLNSKYEELMMERQKMDQKFPQVERK